MSIGSLVRSKTLKVLTSLFVSVPLLQAIPVLAPKVALPKASAVPSTSDCISSNTGFTVSYDATNGCVIKVTGVGSTTITLPSWVSSITFSMIGGGGGGGSNRGGGGGAGAYIRATSSISSPSITAVVGAGGTGGAAPVSNVSPAGSNGSDSSLTLTNTSSKVYKAGGGGGGGSHDPGGTVASSNARKGQDGNAVTGSDYGNGGSGGGASINYGSTIPTNGVIGGAINTCSGLITCNAWPGAKSSATSTDSWRATGGGGGANTSATNSSLTTKPDGASGITDSITGIVVGGGGGGASGAGSGNPCEAINNPGAGSGGSSIGGNGEECLTSSAAPGDGAVNTGSGGGGGNSRKGGNGGSGFVAISYSLPTSTVTFNNNTGTGTMTAQSNQGAATLSANTFTKNGYVFGGWCTVQMSAGSACSGGTFYADQASYSFTSSITLYAVWTNGTYTVTYNYNNATGGNSTTSNDYTTGGTAITLPVPTKTGYTFSGWYVASDFSGSALGSTYSPTSSLTIYAKWTANTNNAITWNHQSATSFDQTGASTTYTTGSTIANIPTTPPTKVGYDFGGWFTAINGGGTQVTNGNYAPPSPYGAITLYAKWTAKTFTVKFNTSGGSTPPSDVTSSSGASFTLPTAPTKLGYTFAGWCSQTLAANGTCGGSQFLAGTATQSMFDTDLNPLTLYAFWTAASQSISYNSNNGAGTIANTTGNTATAVTLSDGTGLSRVGYTLSKWNTQADGLGTDYTLGQTNLTMPAGGLTLYATWSGKSVSYTYNANNGSSTPTGGTANSGATFTTAAAITRSGYTFQGWCTVQMADGSACTGTSYTASNASAVMVASDSAIVLCAYWSAASQSITYNSNNGSGSITNTTGNTASTVTLSDGTGFSRTGYTLSKWNTQADGQGTNYNLGQTNVTMPAGGISLYAVWTINSYTVTYFGNGNTAGSVPNSVTQNYGTSVGVSVTIGALELLRTGYAFAGWNTKGDSTGTSYSPGNTFTLGAADVSLYAVWIRNPQFSGTSISSNSPAIVSSAGAADSTNLSTQTAYAFNNVNSTFSFTLTSQTGETYRYKWRVPINGLQTTEVLLNTYGTGSTSYTISNTYYDLWVCIDIEITKASLVYEKKCAFQFMVNSVQVGTFANIATQTTAINQSYTSPAFAYSSSNDTNTKTYSVVGTLPSGLAINSSTGVISGTPTQSGTYSIQIKAADAQLGPVTSSSFNLVIVNVPSAPQSFTATSNANGQSVLSWSAPASNGGGAITGYTVTATAGGSAVTVPASCQSLSSSATGCTFTGLSNGTTYTFSVTASNSAGAGTAATTTATPASTPGVPQSFTASSAADARSVLAWTAPATNGGSAITGYTVTASYSGGSVAATGCTSLTSTSTGCTLTGLTNGTLYTFTVAAVNALGTGGTASATATPSTVPGAPTSVSATSNEDAKSTVTWTAPVSNGGAAIDYYSIYISTNNSTFTFLANTANGSTTSYVATGLTNDNRAGYYFQVTAHNASGDSVKSTSSNIAKPMKTLGNAAAPTVTATSGSTTSLDVSWTTVTYSDGMRIKVYSSAAGGTPVATHDSLNVTSYSMTGLTAGTDYWVSVTAIPNTANASANIPGAESSFTKATTNAAAVAPTITTQPININRTYGQKSTFSVVATATDGGTLSYQWQKDGVNISGATSATYTSSAQNITGSYGVFTVNVTNSKNGTTATTTSSGVSATYAATLTVTTPSSNLLATVGAPFSYQIATTGGTAPLTYSLYWYGGGAGSLPAGLSLNSSTGVISGTPTTAGDSTNFIFQVVDAAYDSANCTTCGTIQSGNYRVISVAAAMAFSASASQSATVGTLYSQSFAATGGNGTLTYSGSGTLPTGLTLSGSTISGTPSADGTFNYTITATDSIGATKSLAITFTVVKGTVPTVTFASGLATDDGYTVSANGVTAGYTYAVSVPTGSATLGGNGTITVTGVTPVGTGTSVVVTVTVTKSGYTTGTFTYTGTTKAAPLNPTFGSVTRTADGFKVIVTNYSTAYQWTGTSTAGGSVGFNTTTGEMVVSGIAANTYTTVTVSTAKTGYVAGSGSISATSLAASSISVALPGNATTATYGTTITLTATASMAGSVAFKDNGTVITGCGTVTISSSPWTATCSWTPGTVATRSITAVFTPTDSANYAASTSTTVSVVVGQASLGSPTVTAAPIAGSTTSIRLTITHAANSTGTYWAVWPTSTGGPATSTGTATTGTTSVDVTFLSANTTYYLDFYAVGSTNYANGSTSSPRIAVTTNTTWTISYNYSANGSTGDTSTTYIAGAAALTLPTPTARTGYTQSGWFDAASNGNKIGNGGDSYTPTGSITLYFQWTPINYTITYKAGTNGTGSDIIQNFNVTATPVFKTASEVSSLITRTGYHVAYWNTDPSGTGGTSYVLGNTFYTTLASLVLYPTWAIDTFTITTSAGSNSTISVTSTNNYGTNKTVTFSASTGYSISSITVDGTGLAGTNLTTAITAGSYTFSNITANHTISVAATGKTYTVTYKPGANSSGSDVVDSFVYPGSLTIKDSATTAATFLRTGYTATGWSDTDGGLVWVTLGSTYSSAANLILYPVWSRINYVITYDGNGNTNSYSYNDSYQDGYTRTFKSGGFTKTGYVYTTWNTRADGTGLSFNAGDAMTLAAIASIGTTSITLYAQWVVPVPTITSFAASSNSSTSVPYGDTVTITGTNFTGATSVTIGGVAVTSFTVISSTSITFTSNKACCTVGKVAVTTPGGTTTSSADLTPLPQLPVITTQPSSQTKSVGQSVTFTVVASTPADGGILSYQWKKNTTTISGATSASYTFTTTALTDADNYWVIVTNTISTSTSITNSSNAALTMNKGSQATLTVTSTSGTYGDALTLSYSGGTTSGAVTYSTATLGCSIAGTGPYTLSSTSAQTCVVTATMAGNTNYNDVTSANTNVVFAARAITVKAGNVTVSYSSTITPTVSVTSGTLASGDALSGATYNYSGTSPVYASSTTAPIGVGTYTITPSVATFSTGSASNYSITYATGTLTINTATQTITNVSTAPTNAMIGVTTYTISATGGGGTKPLVFASTTSAVCLVNSSTGVVSFTFVSGTCTLTINQAADTGYTAAAQVSQSFSVAQNNQSTASNISFSSADVTYAPTFSSSTYSYSANIPNGSTSSTLRVVASWQRAQIKYSLNGAAQITMGYGDQSSIVSWALGSNTLVISITAADSSSTQSYTFTVNRPSNNANLSALTTTAGSISFSSGTSTYTLTVANSVSSITVTPTVADANATVTVAGVSVASGTASGSVSLTESTSYNSVAVVVTAQDGTRKTYELRITRPFAVSSLTGLSLTSGTLSPTFASGTTSYTATVTSSTTYTRVIASWTSNVSEVAAYQLNNGGYAGNGLVNGSQSSNITLNYGDNTIDVLGTAQDGSTTKYTVVVTRTKLVPTISIALTAGATTGKVGVAVNIIATTSVAGAVNFKLGGTTITGCGAIATVTSGTTTATCSWTPDTANATSVITAEITPTDSTTYSNATSSNLTINVGKGDQATLTTSATTSSSVYTGTAYTASPSFSTSGGSGTGAVTYAVISGGTATSCTLSDNSASATLTATASGTCLIAATKAADSNYNSVASANFVFTFNKATLATPADPTVTQGLYSANELVVTWVSITNASSYLISWYDSTGSTLISTYQASSSATTYTITSLTASTSYKVTIRANGTGNYQNSLASNMVSATTKVQPALPATFTVTYKVGNGSDVSTSGNTLISVTQGQSVTLSINVTSSDGGQPRVGFAKYKNGAWAGGQESYPLPTTYNFGNTTIDSSYSVGTATGFTNCIPTTYTGTLVCVQARNNINSVNSSLSYVGFGLDVYAALSITGSTQLGTIGTAFTMSGAVNAATTPILTVSGGKAYNGSQTYLYSATGLPAGLSIDSATGAISGTPTAGSTSGITSIVTITDGNGATKSANVIFNIPAAQTITLTNPGNKVYGAANFTASASSTSNLTVSISSLTTSVCTVSGTTVSIVGAGTCTLAADQAGNSSYAVASQVTQSFTVSASAQASLSISALTTSANYSGTAFTATPTFSTTGGSGTGAVTYSVSDGTATGCTLSNSSSSATLTASAPGTCLIAATKASDSNYASITSSSLTFTFSNLSATLSITSTAPTNAMVDKAPYSVTTSSGASSGSITLSTNDITKCSITNSDVVFNGPGTCILTATQAAATGYASGTVTQTFTVAPSNVATIGTFFPVNFTISPTFAINTTTYTSTVPAGTSTVAFAVAPSRSYETIQYKFNTGSYTTLSSGTNTPNLSLNYGDNTISVLMTAQDGTTTMTYTFTITRAQSTSTISIALTAGATTATYNTAVNIIATTSNIPGNVNFKVGGTTITGCVSKSVSGGFATCSWTPDAANANTVLTATFTPTDTVANTIVTSSDLTINVAKATRPNLTQTTTEGTYGYTIPLGNSGTLGTGSVSYATTTTGCRISGGNLEADYVTTCSVTVTQQADSNYLIATSAPVNVVVHPKAFTITAGNNGATYTGSTITLATPTTYIIPALSIVGNDSVTGVLFEYVGTGSTVYAQSSTLPTNVGTYAIVPATIQMPNNQINNYTVTRVNGTLTITARGLSTPTAPTITATAGVLKSLTVNWTAVTNAVAYTLKIYETDGTTLLATVTGLSGTSKVITATEFSGILDNHSYKMTLTATGDANNSDSTASALSSSVTTNKSYAITYNTNNSTGGTAPTAGSWITGASASLIAANSGTLVRSGYTFAGWNTAANGSGTDYAATGSVTYSTAADLILYAKWTANGLTITYKSDYASGPVDVTETKTADVAFNLRTNTFTRTGYSFAGWALTSGGAVAKADSVSVTVLADTTYYAQWTAVNYTVTYNGNNNTGGSVPTDSANYNIGGSVTVKGNTGSLVRTGYSFNGWTDDSGNTGTLYLPGTANTTYTVGSSNITFYAKWSKDTYYVAYDSQGGSSVLSSAYQIGDTVTLASGPTKTGYAFAGWATTVGGNSVGLTYAPPGIGLVTLYAKWTAINYRIYYSSNNGNGGTVPSDTNNYNIGGTVTVVGNTSNVSRTGYTWSGWNTAADGTGTTYQAAGTFAMGSADVNLYAKWTPINYTITYDANGATSGTAPVDSANYNIGQNASVLGFNGLSRTGYSLWGWATTNNATVAQYQSGASITFSASNITLYAVWHALTYTVTFSSNGASGTPSTTSASYTTGGTAITLPTVGTMAKTGNSFSGWATTSNGTPLTSPYTTAQDITLVAVWTPVNYTITYAPNGGSITPTQSALQMGQQFTLASAITKPNGSNGEVYAFTGWNDGTTTWQAGITYTVGTANLTFTAQWVRVYEVNYVLNGANSTQPANQLKNDGDVITLAATPTKPGYLFQGWMDQSGQTFSAGQTGYTVGLLHYTLSAQWSAVNYTITYDANGGATTPQQPAKNIGQTFNLANAITRTGYSFNGWSDGSQVLAPGAQILVGTSNLTFTAQWTADVYTVIYDLNGGTGTAITNASYTYGSAAITLPLVGDRVRTNYTFGGWSTTNNGATVGLTYTPTASTTLYAVWTLNQYTVTYNGNAANVSNSTAQYTAGGAALTLPTVTRSSFVFKGWYSASTGGNLIGQAGGTYTPTATGSIYAQWTQLSLSGVNEADLSLITTANASASVGITSTFTTSNSSVSVTIPAGALPTSTVVTYNLLASNATRAVSLPAGSSYILSLVVSWVAPDGSVPTTATGKPIVMVVSSASIKKGASVYAIAGSSIQFLGVATQDGSVTVNITDDPEVAIVKTKPGAPTGVSATNGLDASTVVIWSAPTTDGGDPIANYTVYDNNGNIVCVTSSLACSVSGLTNGVSYTFTVKAANAVGFSDASSPSAAITPVSAAPIVTPPTPTPPSNNGGTPTPAPERPAAPVTPAKPPLQVSLQEITNIQSTTAHANVVVKWPGKAFTVEVCATLSGSTSCEQSKKFVVNSEDQMELLPTGEYLLSADFAGLKSSGRYMFTALMSTEDQQSASQMRSIKTPSGITLTVPATINSPLNSNLTVTVQAQNVTGYVKIWNAVGLPAGLRISKNSASLVITGTAKTAGTYFVDVTATDTDKGTASTRFILTVAGAVAPTITIKSATMQPLSISTSTIAWIASASGNFEVIYDGKSVCKTTTTSCVVKDLLGPLSKVQVVTRDSSGAINYSTAATYVSPVKPIEVGSAKFALNSSNLVTAQKKAVEKLAATLQAKGFTQIVVSGYADSTGSKALNAKISTDRAKNTYAYLNTFLSSKPLSVTLSGKASTNPIASNATEAGRAANRRAVVSIS